MSFRDIANVWGLLETSLHAVFGIDLEDVWHRKSWRWFAVRVSHLLSTDNPLGRHFAPDPDEPTPENVGGEE